MSMLFKIIKETANFMQIKCFSETIFYILKIVIQNFKIVDENVHAIYFIMFENFYYDLI